MPKDEQSGDLKLILDEATLFYAMGDIEAALARFEEILEKDPCCKEARRMRARCRQHLGLWTQSDLDWYEKGNALRVLGRHAEAIRCYEEAIALDDRFADAWGNMGVCYGQMGNHQKARECLQRALDLCPNDPHWHYNMGIALEKLRETEKAFEHYAKAEKLNPKFKNPLK